MSKTTLGNPLNLVNGSRMKQLEGGCYCGALRYIARGEPVVKAQCHCRQCQYVSGGGPNYFLLMPQEGFEYVEGTPTQFSRPDIEHAVTRIFCAQCGTHTSSQRPGVREEIVKVGTLDDPSYFGGARIALFTSERQSFHSIADDTRQYETLPKRE